MARKHEDIEHINSINVENNKVVCYEFNAIYGKFLEELGINFETKQEVVLNNGYGGGHANLKFRAGKFLVSADSVVSILQGDMVMAKLNQPLNGLRCLNVNTNTSYEFYDILTKMYDLIVSQETNKANERVEYVETFDDILNQYRKTISSPPNIPLDERLDILTRKLNDTNLPRMDSLSYALQLRKVLFTEEEVKNNIAITIIRNNDANQVGQVAEASAIFTVNTQSNIQNEESNSYYLYNPNEQLLPISRDDLQAKFDNGTFDYVTLQDPKIPGITSGGVKK